MAKANLQLVRAEYQGTEIQFNEQGWFNATQAADRFRKRPNDWLSLDSTKEYLAALAESTSGKIPYVKTRTGRPGVITRIPGNYGTWFHPKLVVPFARWLDVRFAVWCDEQIDSLIRGSHPVLDWCRLRHASSSSFKMMEDILKDTRLQIGKATEKHHYSNEARLINWALTGEFKAIDRDKLPICELDVLTKLEVRNAVLIGRGLSYEKRKNNLEQYAIDLRPALLALAQ